MAFTFPQAALDWLFDGLPKPPVRGERASLLTFADSSVLPRGLARLGYQVTAVDARFNRVRPALGSTGMCLAVARPEALPFDDCRFEGVLVYQVFAEVVGGLSEIARVLRPGGRLMISQLSRDDTVPWVRDLSELLHSVDHSVMSPQDGDPLAAADASKYFTGVERRDFRHWEAVTRDDMLEMVTTPSVGRLTEPSRSRFLRAAADIYTSAAGGNELRLPYRLRCWHATVDQEELTTPVSLDDPALVIAV